MKHILAIFSFLLSLAILPAEAIAQLRTQVFNRNFRSLKVSNPDNFFAQPVIRLNTNDRLLFSFDEIGDDYSYLEYRLVHCNADWKPSDLADVEFVPRFNSVKIEDFSFSSNTYIHYVNYHIEIPNDEIAPLVSGNYILQVFPEQEPDRIILQARFCVTEASVAISGSADGRTDVETDDSLQQLRFKVATQGLDIRDPVNDLFAVVEQNSDPNSARVISRPLSVNMNGLTYDHSRDLIFPAGNEFRRFETVRADYPGLHVDSIGFSGNNYHVYLATDYPRDDREYTFDSTQQGRFIVREHNASDSDLGADYVTVHFSLDTPPLSQADIYVQGEFSAFRIDPVYRLAYNTDSRRYELSIPLKQGSYNYRYVVVPKGKNVPTDKNPVEGDKYETLNEYTIKIFYRPPGARADRLLGTTSFITNP